MSEGIMHIFKPTIQNVDMALGISEEAWGVIREAIKLALRWLQRSGYCPLNDFTTSELVKNLTKTPLPLANC